MCQVLNADVVSHMPSPGTSDDLEGSVRGLRGQDGGSCPFSSHLSFLGNGCAESLNYRCSLIRLGPGVCLFRVCGLEHVSQCLQGSVFSPIIWKRCL